MIKFKCLFLYNNDTDTLDWFERLIVVVGRSGADCINYLLPIGYLAKHRMLGGRGHVEEVEESIARSVDEELRTSSIGCSCVRHGYGVRLVGYLRATWMSKLIGN